MKRVLVPLFLLVLLLGIAPAAMAAPLQQQDTIIESGEVVNNDVVVLEGDLVIHEGATVNGDVTVFKGDATVDGQVNGSLTLFDGDLEAGPAASLNGECVLLNGEFDNEAGEAVKCTDIENLNLEQIAPFFENAPNWFKSLPAVPAIPAIPPVPSIPPIPTIAPIQPVDPVDPVQPVQPVQPAHGRDRGNDGPGVFGRFGIALGNAFLAGLFGLFIGAVMGEHLQRITRTAKHKPVASGGVGVLTAIAVPSLIVLLIPLSVILTFVCIGLLGFPIMLLLALGLVWGILVGWVAVGAWLGQRLFGGEKTRRVATTAALGTFILTFLVGLVGVPSPFLSGLLGMIIASIGLGAVVLTQFGSKPYPRTPEAGAPPAGEDPNKVQVVLDTLPPEEKLAS